MEQQQSYDQLKNELDELRMQLEEANDVIEAIRTGQADALVIQGEDGHQLYTLKSADQTYRVFIEKMNEGAITLNHEGVILYCNSSFAGMVEKPLELVMGQQFESFVDPYSLKKYNSLITSGWNGDCKGEIFLSGADGNQVCCLLSCNTLELDDGEALSLILTDLTEQKNNLLKLELQNDELEEAHKYANRLNSELEEIIKERTSELSVSREHLKLLSDHIPQMTWTNQPGGEVDFFNQQWYDYTGKDFESTKDWGWQDIVHPDDLTETSKRYFEALSSGKLFQVENRYLAKDGSYRWHLNRALPLRNDDGEILFWVGTATDIEEQKRQMEKKDEFIGIASHELKTPLTSLKGYLQLITGYKKEQLPPAVMQYLQKANLAINKLQYLINDLLDVSKINAGRLDYTMSTISVKDIVNNCVENAAHIFQSNTFEKHADAEYLVNGNAERLEQVLMNFISNAVKYSQVNKNVIITTSVYDGRYARTAVTDFGIGLSAEEIDRIFERFYRVEDKKFMTSGLGMGLYIATELINTHKGKIGVESEPGNGATFYFDLPLLRAEK